ncbi:MAG: pantoate--beta-alanine ligase [Xanthomonadales bacterium]|nr:pantoate--beta-alanine ligase [Xanthomonadales bacterium]
MLIVRKNDELRALLGDRRRSGQRIGFVPTMGNLHAGHYSLIARARQCCDFVVASIFVNPTQFGINEDFSRYPRTPEQDALGLGENGCDLLFLPDVETIYPLGHARAVSVHVPELGDVLEGASRPGHFDGVATVVARLFNRVQPDAAVFGSKDYQQLLVIRRMTFDLGFPVEIIAAPIIRESNGLAMSSRNQYLDAAQRGQAGAIHETLRWMAGQLDDAVQSAADIEAAAIQRLADAGLDPDYAVIRSIADLARPLPDDVGQAVILIAARLGPVRLIDNLEWNASKALPNGK